ncbi:MAG TPA: Clp protease N-terminal domain-containing protein [Gaiellaceae bacterium]
MFERFTERARQVVVLAQDEARALKHNYIGTEHLLLGLLREEEGLAARVLDSLDVTVDEVRAQVARIVGEGDTVTPGQIPFTPRAKKVLELGLREALTLGHNYIGTEHLLLGLVRENEGVGARILLDFGADADKIRDEVIGMLSGMGLPPQEPTEVGAAPPPASPPVAPEVVAELEKLRIAREAAIEESSYEKAAALRERERRLRRAARQLERAWAGEPEVRFPMRPATVRTVVGPPPRAPDEGRRLLTPLIVGWLLFGGAAALGLLAGRLL